MDRQDTENGRNQRELFYGSYRVHLFLQHSVIFETVLFRGVVRTGRASLRCFRNVRENRTVL